MYQGSRGVEKESERLQFLEERFVFPMASLVPTTIVLALAAGPLGGPDALRLLLAVAGQSPIVDIAICVLVIGAVTAPVLGTMLLARFFRKARDTAAARRAAPTDRFAKMTLMVSVAVAFLVTACFLVALCVELGGAAELRLLLTFAGRRPLVAVAATVGAAAAPVLGTIPLARFIRQARAAASAGGAASPVATARERTPKMLVSLTGAFLLAGCLLVIPFLAARRGPDGATLPCSA